MLKIVFLIPHLFLVPVSLLQNSLLISKKTKQSPHDWGCMFHPPPFSAVICWPCHPRIFGGLGYPVPTFLSACIHYLDEFSIYTGNSSNNLSSGLCDLLNATKPTPSSTSPRPADRGLKSSHHLPTLHFRKCNSRLEPTCLMNSSLPKSDLICAHGWLLSHLDLHLKLPFQVPEDTTAHVQLLVW